MITYKTDKPIERLEKDIEAAAMAHGFGVLGIHDLKAKMNSKGVSFDKICRVYEVCNPRLAKIFLDKDMTISTMLPCRIAVYEKNNALELVTKEPTILIKMFGHPELGKTAQEVEDTLHKIMEAASL